ncbi:MAG TPA: 3'-5' exonuclease [Pseudomonas xinjiangensis]|uniref:3'-5' exonuclease n=2 Tax=root TaxID=1 RepID=A0A7V1BS41_9GAMM|nr:3'-5' exonuclease [Halopseudomonas xinjiangensis]HEC47907.1 3'-5' exonuclease [Halopseudomonas xinjiangensis]
MTGPLAGGVLDWQQHFASLAANTSNGYLAAYYAAGMVSSDTPISQVPMAALDIETTGLDSRHDAIVSVGMVPFSLARIRCQDAFYQVINPLSELNAGSIAFHRITHSEVDEAPALDRLIPELLRAMAGRVIVVHYRHIEREFLNAAFRHYLNDGFQFPVIDTMEIEAGLHPRQRAGWRRWFTRENTESIRLGDSRTRYGLPHYQSHHALTDALATAELLQAQIATHFSADMAVGDLWK